MITSLRQIKARIKSIDNTRRLTRAMEMISVAKLKRTGKLLKDSSLYHSKIAMVLNNVLLAEKDSGNRFLRDDHVKDRIAFFLITSDNGFCGSYNNNIIRAAEVFLKKYDCQNVKMVVVGKKGFSHFACRGYNINYSYLGLNGRYSPEICSKVLSQLSELFVSGEISEVYAAYTRVESASRYSLMIEKILNIRIDVLPQDQENADRYIFEPDAGTFLEDLIPAYLSSKITSIFLDAFNSEHQARAVAMGEATKNGTDLLTSLILLRNKVRQANITREIIEVISAAEALKG